METAAHMSASNTLVVGRLCGSRGLIQGCELVYKVGKVTGYYHGANEL
jgi:hypothetical protein